MTVPDEWFSRRILTHHFSSQLWPPFRTDVLITHRHKLGSQRGAQLAVRFRARPGHTARGAQFSQSTASSRTIRAAAPSETPRATSASQASAYERRSSGA